LICAGSLGLLVGMLGVEAALRSMHAGDDNASTAAGLGFILGLVALTVSVAWYLFRDKKRTTLAQLARNMARDFAFIPSGFTGYLLLVTVFIILGQVFGVYTLVDQFSEFVSKWPVAIRADGAARLSAAFWVADYVAGALSLIFGMVLLVVMFRHRRSAVKLALWYFGILIPLAIMDFFANTSAKDSSPGTELGGMVMTIAVTAACIVYFLRSKQVRATFVEPVRA